MRRPPPTADFKRPRGTRRSWIAAGRRALRRSCGQSKPTGTPRHKGGLRYMRKLIMIAIAALALAVPAVSSASFTAVGVTAPLGFPSYYEDSTSLQVGLCIEDPGCPASPALIDMVPDKDGEAFYQLAGATLEGKVEGRDGLVAVDFNVEAAFLDGTPITFGRIQFTAKNLVPNETYTVDHPYGQSHFTVDASGNLAGALRAAQ